MALRAITGNEKRLFSELELHMRSLARFVAPGCKPVIRPVALTLLLAVLLLCRQTLVYGQTPGPSVPGQRSITVTGNGSASASPDIATVSGQVQAQAPTSSDAVNQASQTIQAVIAAAKGFGASDADIQTSGLSLYPLFTPIQYPAPTCVYTPPGAPPPPVIAVPPGAATPTPLPACATPPVSATPIAPAIYAYQATEGIIVKTTDLTRIGDLIAALVGAGLTNFSGPSYSIQHPQDLQVQAVQAAMANARTIAQAIASAAGVQLGALLSVTTGYINSPIPPPAAPAPPPPIPLPSVVPSVAPVPVQPSSLSAQANVTASYAILPATPTPTISP
jgi:uncharacterized protein YggE